ncbi:hypothetical protein DFH08DRAFT_933480 [Mycena albidolilacea]|uniref:BTB domain-containing protein n=1 Tax=Mycena albidolilacea TaxID=1033008 RepID=A0AAD7ADB2_9AGAR|nr:hypothetical protein DFH08DRAFT_933480 [Mycena albidolilacea]
MSYPRIWFDDGDIVLSASTGYGQSASFLVHQHVLSAHSPTFSAIFNNFSAVRRHNTDGTHDARLLQVDDRAEDLAKPAFRTGHAHRNRRPRRAPSALQKIPNIQSGSKDHYPAQIGVAHVPLDIRRTRNTHTKHKHRPRQRPRRQIAGQYLDDLFPEPASIIRLAREFNIPELLPAAFYALSLISPSADYAALHARLRPDRATAQLARGGRSARWALLAPADLLSLAKGQDQLRSHKTLTRAFETHAHAPACSAGWDVLLGALRELLERMNDVLGALTYLRLYVADQEKAGTARICPSCVKEVYNMIDALRLRIWRNLPWWFGVPEVEFAA